MNVHNLDGGPIDDGQTCITDHSVQVVTVTLRSMDGVPLDALKNLIEKRWDVVTIEEVYRDLYVHTGCPDFASYEI